MLWLVEWCQGSVSVLSWCQAGVNVFLFCIVADIIKQMYLGIPVFSVDIIEIFVRIYRLSVPGQQCQSEQGSPPKHRVRAKSGGLIVTH